MLRRSSIWVLIILYGVAMLPLYMRAPAAADEAYFLSIAENFCAQHSNAHFVAQLWGQRNFLGYGALYWMTQVLAVRFSSDPLLLLRALNFALMLSIPVTLARARGAGTDTRTSRVMAVLLWLTFPVSWWTGKLIGPEIPSLALAASGLACAGRRGERSRRWGWLMMGAAVGVKPSALVIVPFAAFLLWSGWRLWRRYVAYAGASALGFLVANPTVVMDPVEFLENWRKVRPAATHLVTAAEQFFRLSNHTWTWDALPTLGMAQWSTGALALALYIVTMGLGADGRRVWWALGSGCLCAYALCMTSREYYGWYWFPAALLLPFAMSCVRMKSRAALTLASATVLVNAWVNMPAVSFRYRHRMEVVQIQQHKPTIADCVAALEREHGPFATVLDYSEHGLGLEFAKSSRIIEPGRVMVYTDIMNSDLAVSDKTLALVGERLRSVLAPMRSPIQLIAMVPGAREVRSLGTCPHVSVLQIN